jgi:2-dehydro-3-deoxyphosphooctonate aldolase (KDO 8-P synthase)
VDTVDVGGVELGGPRLALIAGPCAIEDPETTLAAARGLAAICGALGVPWVFKASFDKANRTSGSSFRGVGLGPGLDVLRAVRAELGVPVTTDVHEPHQVEAVAEVAELLQIPAFLCRQTDLLVAAGRTGRAVNVKKGPFLAPLDLGHAVEKAAGAGARGVLVTERGTTFGCGDLVVDFRSLVWLRQLGVPVVFDATHAAQRPAAHGDRSGGDRTLGIALGRAAVAVGVDALFAEVHPDPARARSDADTQLPLDGFREVLAGWLAVDEVSRGTGFARALGPGGFGFGT